MMSSDDSDAEFYDAREQVSSPRPSQSFLPTNFVEPDKLEQELETALKVDEISTEITDDSKTGEKEQGEDATDGSQVPNQEEPVAAPDVQNVSPVANPQTYQEKLPKRPSFESTEILGQTPDLLACVQDRPTNLPGVRPVDVVRPPSVHEEMPPPATIPAPAAVKSKVPPPRPAPPKRPPLPKRTYLSVVRPGRQYLSESDDGLLTPNSTVDSITREFTEALKNDKSLQSKEREKTLSVTSNVTLDYTEEVLLKPPEHMDRTVARKGSASSTHTPTSPTSSLKRDEEILSGVIVKNLDTGESMPLSTAAEQVSKCLNPLALQIMSRTREFSIGGSTASVDSFNLQATASAIDHTDFVDSDSLSIASDDIDIGKDATEHKHRKSKKLKGKRKKLAKMVGKKVSKVKVAAGTQIEKAVQKAKHVKDEVSHNDQLNVSSDEDSTELGSLSSIKIKASSSNKGPHHFSHPKQVQDIAVHVGAVWCMKFSHCGRLLATAGQDNVIWVWVLRDFYKYFNDMRNKYDSKEDEMFGPAMHRSSHASTSDTNQSPEDDVFGNEELETRRDTSEDEEDSAPFRQVPFSSYVGHSADVLDLAWSKNFFILSSSMDKTVRLWHISRKECLCCFQHIDFVTAIAFHPRDDRYFLSGSLDSKLRLWNIPDKKVALWNEVAPDGSSSSSCTAGGALITTVNFCENGKFAVCGTYDGRCIFFDTEHLKYHTQIHVRSSRGRNMKGHKITGIEPLQGEHKILVTSNDSRVRLYDLRDLSLVCKYRGHTNTSSQIKASFSPDSKYIICGSEDKCVYIWRTSLPQDVTKLSSFRRDRNDAWESMKTHDAVVTCAVFALQPQLLYKSEGTPETKRKTKPSIFPFKKQEPDEVNVIISADFNGCIKVTVCADS